MGWAGPDAAGQHAGQARSESGRHRGSPALIRVSVCGDSIAGIMIGRFQFSYVISQVSPLYRLIGKNTARARPYLTRRFDGRVLP
ncbi:hypothetical protein GCM10010517_12320 [Streptosporangium fragile]|uniref:Uncharacterized protein n=1 Tax=Streptosporangium fragile TaxID=46186 RepID=A0ABN3VSV6_9ACTN